VNRISRTLLVTAPVLGLLLVAPGTASAGLIDLIWDTSGPQFIGLVGRCRVPAPTNCNLFGVPVKENVDVMKDRHTWLNLEGAYYRSTGKNENGVDFRAWRAEMLAFEPLVEFASDSTGSVRVYHGAGATLQLVMGADFDRFGKAGFKLRPIAAEFGDRWEVAFNLRLYPNGFGADQFGFGPRQSGNRPFERVWGVMAGYKY
jgi:hypothetical protein